MRAGADAGHGEIDRLAVHAFEKFGEIVRRIAGARHKRFRAAGGDGDGLEIHCRKFLVGEQRLVDGKRGGGGKERVAVRLGARHVGGGDIAAGAAAVLDHHGLMQTVAQALADQPRQRVGDAAGRKGDD